MQGGCNQADYQQHTCNEQRLQSCCQHKRSLPHHPLRLFIFRPILAQDTDTGASSKEYLTVPHRSIVALLLELGLLLRLLLLLFLLGQPAPLLPLGSLCSRGPVVGALLLLELLSRRLRGAAVNEESRRLGLGFLGLGSMFRVCSPVVGALLLLELFGRRLRGAAVDKESTHWE